MRRLVLPLALWVAPAVAQVPPPTPDVLISASCTAACTVVLSTSSYAQVVLVASGTGTVLTFALQGTNDGGAHWNTLPAVVPAVPGTFVTSMSANGVWAAPCAGFQQVRVNLTAITAGTETFAISASVRSNMNIGQ